MYGEVFGFLIGRYVRTELVAMYIADLFNLL